MPVNDISRMSDDELLDLARRAVESGPPEHHIDMLMTGYDLMNSDDLVADLAHDSATMAAAAGLRAGSTAVRELAFAAGRVTFDLEVIDDGRTIVGQLIGTTAGEIVAESAERSVTAPVSSDGRFRLEDLTPGPLRLGVDHEGGRAVTTWFVL